MPDLYLAHHGIKGQKWGVRNGPPYPLNRNASTITKGHAKKLDNYKGPCYFISNKKFSSGDVLEPRVPDNYFTKNGFEDAQTPRISFAPSIEQCLAGLSQDVEGNEYYVYEPVDISKCEVWKPDSAAVPDSSITDELWVTNPTRIIQVDKIKVIGNKGTDGVEFKYGKNTAILFDDWIYESI